MLSQLPPRPQLLDFFFFFGGGGGRKKAGAQDSGRVSLELELMNEEIGTRENKKRTKEIKKILFFFYFLQRDVGVFAPEFCSRCIIAHYCWRKVCICVVSASGPQ